MRDRFSVMTIAALFACVLISSISCVEALRDNINDPGSDDYSVTAPVPVNLSATDGTYTDKITVSWEIDESDAKFVSKYELYRADSEAGEYSLVTETEALTYDDTDCGVGIHYWYRVNAVSESGKAGDASDVDSGFRLMTWTRLTDDATDQEGIYGHAAITYNDAVYIIAGQNQTDAYLGRVWSSSDGENWTLLTGSAFMEGASLTRTYSSAVVFNDGNSEAMWVIAGLGSTSTFYNDVWYSTDGMFDIRKTAAAFIGGVCRHTSVVFNGKMWAIGGQEPSETNKIYYSSDGINWTDDLITGHFSARRSHTSVVHDGKMWVIGGYDGTASPYLNDVWSSTDGAIWTRVSEHDASAENKFPPRCSHKSVVFQDRIWVIGGQDNTGRFNDVWCSKDGVTWDCVAEEADFEKRAEHACVVFDDKILVIGGTDLATRYEDAWVSNN